MYSAHQFISAMQAHGLQPPASFPSGKIVRFPGADKSVSNRAGWGILFDDGLGGSFGDYSTGLSHNWRSDKSDTLSDAEREAFKLAVKERTRQHAIEASKNKNAAALLANKMLKDSRLETHPYLDRKGFPDAFAPVLNGELLVRMGDDNGVFGLQRISADGTKKFLFGQRCDGAFMRIGKQNPKHIILCEGYATALSVYACRAALNGDCAVIVCFTAHNLTLVAARFKTCFVIADNDYADRNDRRAGQAAAEVTGQRYFLSEREGEDFNDFHQRVGTFAASQELKMAVMKR